MKKLLLGALLFLLVTACDDKLDFTPKGQTTLSSLSDLELLLNQDYNLDTPISSLGVICNEALGFAINVPVAYDQKNTLEYAFLFYDESVDRANLTTEDTRYSNAYKYINYMNVILDKINEATGGTEAEKASVAAEAHVMRAYLHWLLVNIYARQYDEKTASEDGGIPYVTDIDVTSEKTKLTVQQVYDNILADCADEYIDALPDRHADVLRGDKAWGNAVRAKVLMQMKRYDEALPYALAAIRYNGTLEDRSYIVEVHDWTLERQDANNYIYIGGMTSPFLEILSLETAVLFESGDYVKDYAYMFGMVGEGNECWNAIYGEMDSGITGALECYGMSSWVNNYGITADRMYYTAAECYIRTGKIAEGLGLVNQVRQKRIHPDEYMPFEASTEADAMALLRRAKWIECIATYENFFDCKRWNTEEVYRRTITRELPGFGSFSIAPDSPLWIFPFPANAIRYNPSLTQNY